MLLYITSWTEQHNPVRRSWKGYTFEALDALALDGYVKSSRAAKAVTISDEGTEEARRLLAAYGIADPEAGG